MDPHFLGAMTVSMLEVEHGRLKKELRKLLRWLESEPRPDVVNLPYTLLIGLAGPLKKALDAPICCTLQGEDLFLEGLHEPYRTRSLDLIRQHIPDVECFLAVSDYYAEFMCRYLGIPEHKIEVARLGVSTDGYRRGPGLGSSDKFKIGYFARIAPEKGLHVLAEAYRLVRQQEPGCYLEAAGYMAPEHRAYLGMGSSGSYGNGIFPFTIAACSIERRRLGFWRVSTCCRHPPSTRIRKGNLRTGGDGRGGAVRSAGPRYVS